MKLLFLGGAFWDVNKKDILLNSIGIVQNAADSLQKKYITGMLNNKNVSSIQFINLPFIGVYPKGFKKIFYRPIVKNISFDKCDVHEVGFLNIVFFRLLSRFFNSFVAALKYLLNIDKNSNEQVIVFCYSMHLPFLVSCFLLRFFFRNVMFCVIVPDLPEFMVQRKGIERIIHSVFAKVSYGIVSRMDFVVAITSKMLVRLKVLNGFVIEGMSDTVSLEYELNQSKNFFLYTGTLDKRYGVIDLVNEFLASNIKNHQLLICGDGDAKDEIIRLQQLNKNLIYMGQLSREEVMGLQRNATALINPRNNLSDFTKYSFPSKILEYMSSGTPVLMYKLDGIPVEYFDFCYLIDDFSGGLAEAFQVLSITPKEDLLEKGASARDFVVLNKNPNIQVFKLFEYIKERFNVQR